MMKAVKSQKLKVESKRGFTLIEIIIAVGIFMTAVTISIGALLGLFDANNKSQSLSSVIGNLNYSVENMTRIIRFATTYHCGDPTGILTLEKSCPNGDTFLAVSTSSSPIIYRLNGTKLEASFWGSAYTPITSNEVTIQHARFYTFNTTPANQYPASGSNDQPYVLLIIRGFAGDKPSTQSTFDIQTVVSQRELDL